MNGSSTKERFLILVINPGSTSTKLSLFANDEETVSKTIPHSTDELKPYKKISEQTDFRLKLIENFLSENRVNLKSIDAFIGRGGLLKPIESGVYAVNDAMLDDLGSAKYGEHASNLGGILAYTLASRSDSPAFIADPVVVDEMEEVARLSGIPEIERKSIFHALNQKSSAREVARSLGKKYEECNFIVAHLGGGISVGAHRKGRVVDVNNALDGEGPYSPERSGGVPVGQLLEMAMKDGFTYEEMKRKITGAGGITSYCGTNDLQELHARIERGDGKAGLVFEAMAYQISKEIAMHGATLKGDVDRIILTGGMAHDEKLTELIKERTGFIAKVEIVPGEKEMVSLALSALAALKKELPVKSY